MIQIDMQNPEARWRWFRYERDGKSFEVELFGRTISEAEAASRKHGDNVRALQRHVADHWFRDFRGINGADGQPLPNTTETRVALMDVPAVGTFIALKLADAGAWLDEGNAGSGTA